MNAVDLLERIAYTRRWASRALCLDLVERGLAEPDLWYPERGAPNRAAGGLTLRERRAKAVCVRCPVREVCLRDALETGDPWGIWGGAVPAQRMQVAHRPDCRPGTRARPRMHEACRPLDERVAILLEMLDDEAVMWGLGPPQEEDVA